MVIRYGEPAKPLGKDTCTPVYPDSSFKHAAEIVERGKTKRQNNNKGGGAGSAVRAAAKEAVRVSSYMARSVARAMPTTESLIAADGDSANYTAEPSEFAGAAALLVVGLVGVAGLIGWRRRTARARLPTSHRLIPSGEYTGADVYTEFTPAAPPLD